jgi:WD40 repeat protein
VILHGPVRADKDVGTGKATVTLAMEWKGMPIASTKHAVQVLDAPVLKELTVSSRLVRSLPHSDRKVMVPIVRFTSQGMLLAAGYPSGVIQSWDIASGKELRRIETPKDERNSLDFVQTTADFRTLIVPVEGGKLVRDADDPKKPLRVEFEGKILVWDLATGKPKPDLKPLPGHGVSNAYVSLDGSRLITTERPGRVQGEKERPTVIRMIDPAKGRSWVLAEGRGMAAFTPDGKRAYVALSGSRGKPGGGLLVFDREGKEQPPLVGLGKQVFRHPAISPDGKRLVVSASKPGGSQPGSLKVFDLASGKAIADFVGGGDSAFPVPFSPDGCLLAAGDDEGNVKVFDVAKRSFVLEHKFEGSRIGGSVAFSKDGRRLAVPVQEKTKDEVGPQDPLDQPQPRIFLFDLSKRTAAPTEIVCPHGVMGQVAFSADGKTLAVGSWGAVHLFDVSGQAK